MRVRHSVNIAYLFFYKISQISVLKWLNVIFIPPSDEVGVRDYGVASNVHPSVHLSTFRFRSRSQKPSGDFFHIEHTYLL